MNTTFTWWQWHHTLLVLCLHLPTDLGLVSVCPVLLLPQLQYVAISPEQLIDHIPSTITKVVGAEARARRRGREAQSVMYTCPPR